jgi:hypothetical protein
MAQLKIPTSEYAAFEKLARLDDASLASLAKALEEVAPRIVELDLAKALEHKITSIPPADLRMFTRTLGALSAARASKGRSVDEIAKDVRETIVSEKPKDFPVDLLPALEVRLKHLLSIGDVFGFLAKAMSVLTEHDHVFCGARVMSDVRPIFGDSPNEISAAMLVHTLNISYHESGQHKEFYAAMNPSDLQRLKKVIERAESKSNTLRSYVQKSGVRYLEDVE